MTLEQLALNAEDWAAVGSVVQAAGTLLTLIVAVAALRYAALT